MRKCCTSDQTGVSRMSTVMRNVAEAGEMQILMSGVDGMASLVVSDLFVRLFEADPSVELLGS